MTDNRTTEKLCKLLRERGVEYMTNDDERAYDEPAKTTWDFVLCGYEMTVTATEFVDVEGKTYLEMDFHHAFTPEQAIAATLGSGTLTAKQVMVIAENHQPEYCSNTHVCFDWQAIADELNELGSGTCEMETDWDYLHDGIPDAPEDTWAYKCSACGWSFRYDRGIKPNFCPNCCARVKAMER